MNWIKRLFDFFSFKFVAASNATTERLESEEALNLLKDYFESSGGVAGAIKRFEANGFRGKVRSWVSSGPNLPLNSVEALQLIGWKDLRLMALKADIPVERLRELLAEFIPVALDRATPEGHVQSL
jgi:uncharacterized protein YidB (DUF937 family)